MPYRRKYPTRKRKRKTRAMTRFRSMKAPLPTVLNTKLIYQGTVSLNPGAGGIAAVNVFSANGLFDPNVSGVGHQPRGFDELMPLYDHYVVHSAQCQVQMCAQDTTTPKQIGINLRDSSTVETDPNGYKESSYTTYKTCAYGGNQTVYLKKNIDVRKFLTRGNLMSDPECKGTVATNPTEQAYFHVWVAPIDTSDAGVEYVDVRLIFNVSFVEPKQPAQS